MRSGEIGATMPCERLNHRQSRSWFYPLAASGLVSLLTLALRLPTRCWAEGSGAHPHLVPRSDVRAGPSAMAMGEWNRQQIERSDREWSRCVSDVIETGPRAAGDRRQVQHRAEKWCSGSVVMMVLMIICINIMWRWYSACIAHRRDPHRQGLFTPSCSS